MRYFFTIAYLICFQYGFSQNQSHVFLFDLDKENYRSIVDAFSLAKRQVHNARVEEINSSMQLDSIITYTFNSENDSSLHKLEVHFPDEYGNDTLVVTSFWNESNQRWELHKKNEFTIDPLTKWIRKDLSYRWNSSSEAWLPDWHLWRFPDEYGHLDSLASFNYDQNGELSYAHKQMYESTDDGQHRIGTQINLNLETGEWQFYNRIETYLNEEGNIDLEITEYWNDMTGEFENSRKLIYDWDSAGNDLVLLAKRWDMATSSWLDERVDIRKITDENGSSERINLRWDELAMNWRNSRRVIMTLNDIGKMIELKGDNWSESKSEWEPLFEANWEYDEETGYRSRWVDHQVWDTNTKNWTYIKSEEYEYIMEKKYSEVSRFTWDFNSAEFQLDERDFYIYKERQIIDDVPYKVEVIYGPDTLCVNSEEIIYKTNKKSDIKSFLWSIVPSQAGDFSQSDSTIVLTLKQDYVGPLGIAVAGENVFGTGEYSDTLEIFIMNLPDKPMIPVGPTELNQFTGTVMYSTTENELADKYIWKVDRPEAGVFWGDGSKVNFDVTERFEGEFNITIRLQNRCGLGAESEPLSVNAYFITALSSSEISNNLKIYPNPAKDHFQLDLSQCQELRCLKIIDLNGKEVMSKKLSDGVMRQSYSIRLDPGLYTVLIETIDKLIYKRLIVE